MGTGIPYVDEVWNPVVGCTKCSPGCDNCWAEKFAHRLSGMGQTKYRRVVSAAGNWRDTVCCDDTVLDKPLHWRKPRKILTCSMGDLFHPKVPFEFIDKVFATMARSTQLSKHTFMVLTKRVDRMLEYYKSGYYERVGEVCSQYVKKSFPNCKRYWPEPFLDKLHLGVTICNQAEADEKIPILLSIPAAHRWLSVEPLLGPINLEYIKDYTHPNQFTSYDRIYSLSGKKSLLGHELSCDKINQVIIGCESGTKRRPITRKHIKDLYEQCKAAGVDVMVKQMAENEDGTGKVIHDLERIKAELGVRRCKN